MDMLQGADAPWGWSSCNCHPNCGILQLIVVNKKTGQMTSLFDFFNYERFMKMFRSSPTRRAAKS
jgi:hypothetical protein